MIPGWIELALKIIGVVSLMSAPVLWVLGRGRKQANVTISKSEGEVYKVMMENKLAEVHLNEIIDAKVEVSVTKFKNILWEAQKEHYEIKLEMQERLIKVLKEKNEVEQENQILKNELHEIREEYQTCLRQVEMLRKEVENLKPKI